MHLLIYKSTNILFEKFQEVYLLRIPNWDDLSTPWSVNNLNFKEAFFLFKIKEALNIHIYE